MHSFFAQQLDAARLAVAFLTRIPVGQCMMVLPEEFPPALFYFPLVGAFVGMWAGAVFALASLGMSADIALLLSMAATIFLTGSFHEDGLADSADGLMGGHTAERRLEIMKDSRIGTHGTLALWFLLTAKFLLLQPIAQQGAVPFLVASVAAHAIGRASSLAMILCLPAATTTGSSISRPFTRRRPWLPCLAGATTAILLLFLLVSNSAWLALALVTVVFALCLWYFWEKIRGITGDCLGAVNQLSELAVYAALSGAIVTWQ